MTGELLVGRDPELATLSALLDDALSGRGRSVVLLGDAGIGKTRLAEAVADLAAARGCAVAWGRCPDGEAPPYWSWRQAFRALGGGADRLFVTTEGAARAELFASVADALEAATVDRPAVILLEDVHWADASSLALARFIVGTLPGLRALLVMTARDDPIEVSDESAAALAALPPAVLRLPLSGLDVDATAAVVNAIVGDAPPDLLAAVQARTGGNPFFVTEVARLHALRGTDAIDVPRGVHQVLTRRLAHLSQPAAEVLALAAVAGAPRAELLAKVAGRPMEEINSLLAEAAAARLLTPTDTGFDFAHDLVRETVYDEQSPAVRAGLHRRTAEALETLSGASAADLATHWMRAGEGSKAAGYALDAGHAALASMGYEQALRYFRWALDANTGDRVDVLAAMGEAQMGAGQLAAGRVSLGKAVGLARTADRPADAARAVLAMGMGIGGFEVDLADERQQPALEWAVDRLDPEAAPMRAAVLARLSLLLAGRPENDERRVALSREAVDVARAGGDARAEVSALAAVVEAQAGPDHVGARLESTARMTELAKRIDDAPLLLLARRMHVVALLENGRLAEVDDAIDAYARVADRLRLPLYSWPVPMWRGMRALMNGDVDTATRSADDVEAIGLRAGSGNAQIMAFTLRMGISMQAGLVESFVHEAEAAYDAWLGDLPDAYQWAPAAWFAHTGATDRARALVRTRMEHRFDDMPKDSEWLEMAWMAGEAGRLLGELDAVELSYELVQPYADLWVVDGIGGACYGVASFQLGRLAAALGRAEDAQRWLSAALAAHRKVGAHLLTRLTEEELARLGQPVRPKTAAATPVAAAFRREGRVWRVAWRGDMATVPDSKGMRDLAVLLVRPGHEVSALDLVEATGGPGASQADAGPRLDRRARDEYRQRITDLTEDLAEAEANADTGRAAVLSEEREFLVAELAGAVGLGGRARTAGDPVERARKAVTMRVGTAVKAIAEVHPPLARHLRASVSTGRFCSYQPEDPVAWDVKT
jgi:tetratricopeptide (TPR) repeat protein